MDAMNPLKTLIFETLQTQSSITDTDLINELKKKGVEIMEHELNKVLLHLEIQGLVSVRWMGKDKRRIEKGIRTAKQPQTIR
jgi:DNA-binding PadR family transcriptional regulator